MFWYIFTERNLLENCTVTSPSAGTIRVSCDSSHQIAVSVTCTSCNNSMVTNNGSSPLTVGGLDPGIMYTVMISVFDNNQVITTDQMVTRMITVKSDKLGDCMRIPLCMYMCIHMEIYTLLRTHNLIIYHKVIKSSIYSKLCEGIQVPFTMYIIITYPC